MDSRDDLARVLEREFGAFLAHDPYKPDVFWGLRADAILAAGWVPGELLAAEQARNATLSDTIQRVRAVCDEADAMNPEDYKTGQGHLPLAFREINYHEAFMALAKIVNRIEAALDGAGEEDG